MSKATKIWLIIATSLVLLGLAMLAAVMTVCKWNFNRLGTVQKETNTYVISDEFREIKVDIDTSNISFVISEENECKVVCYEDVNWKHSVFVREDKLTIDKVDQRKWYENIGISFESPKVTIYIPQDFEFDSIDIAVSTGNVTMDKVICKGDISINVSTGRVKIKDTKCRNMVSGGSTGEISLEHVIVAEKMSIQRSTGDVKLEACDAAEIFISTDTGDVEGSLLTEKVFITDTDTGSVEVPKTTNGGTCEINTDTGDIEITIKENNHGNAN